MHLISPTYYLFEEIGGEKTHTLLAEDEGFLMDIRRLEIPDRTTHNDACPLARRAEAAAIAFLEHIDKIRDRVGYLKNLTKEFAKSLQELGIKTYPTETYFFLAGVPRMSGDVFSEEPVSQIAQEHIMPF